MVQMAAGFILICVPLSFMQLSYCHRITPHLLPLNKPAPTFGNSRHLHFSTAELARLHTATRYRIQT